MKHIWNKVVEAVEYFTKGPLVPHNLCVVVMDGADRTEHVDIPLKETISFLEMWSRFRFNLTVIETKESHTLDTVVLPSGALVYRMLRDNMTPEFLNNLPLADSYLFLYSTRDPLTGVFQDPHQAGSSMGVPDGILKNGLRRPYATVVWDVRWYGNWPTGGFNSQAAQILVHEQNNNINNITAWTPYNCTPFDVTGGPSAYEHEKKRIQTLTSACYRKIKKLMQSAD